ncbi:hypothetical protein F4780DRAFT_774558 [Xylariomycetidae sp. FL0641]|nr:hypothetical protein F4780DRAFT_774558 [Xylariomycetidae sp. FL0641]
MPRSTPTRARFDILSDHYDESSGEDDHLFHDPAFLKTAHLPVLRDLDVAHLQNRQSPTAGSQPAARSSSSTNLQQVRVEAEGHQLSRVEDPSDWAAKYNNRPSGNRHARKPLAANTFEVLETVPEDQSSRPTCLTTPRVSGAATQHYVDLPVNSGSQHPLSLAASHIPAIEEQIAKHREGLFEWILSFTVPTVSAQCNTCSDCGSTAGSKKVYFGCNLLPNQSSPENNNLSATSAPSTYRLLLTPIACTKEVLEIVGEKTSKVMMTSFQPDQANMAPTREMNNMSLYENDRAAAASPANPASPRAPASPRSLASPVSFGEGGSLAEIMGAGSPGSPVERIEDSFEAIDSLEEQLEAFDEAAHTREMSPSEKRKSGVKSVKFATPQPKKQSAGAGSASVRAKPATDPRQPASRRSELADSLGSPTNKSKGAPLASLLPPKPLAKSTKQPTHSTFELPGAAIARKLKEQREARQAAQSSQSPMDKATRATASSIRRIKSDKVPTRPTFELPGEAISRRKREQHEAQLKAKEEEEKKRREFKARPVGSKLRSNTLPRETAASRARQNNAALAENSGLAQSSAGKRASMFATTRPALSNANNQAQPRGRVSQQGTPVPQESRASSQSVGSVDAKRRSMSVGEAQQQRLRAQSIYRRDSAKFGVRDQEKREREAVARTAREEASERSRQKSREWAAKQARKRMTISSAADLPLEEEETY